MLLLLLTPIVYSHGTDGILKVVTTISFLVLLKICLNMQLIDFIFHSVYFWE